MTTSSHTAWIFSEQAALYPELATLARQVTDRVNAIAVAGIEPRGASTLYRLAWPDDRLLEDSVASMAALIRSGGPALVVLGASRRCKVMAVRLAAALGGVVINDVTALAGGAAPVGSRMVYGGLGQADETVHASSVVLTVGAGMVEPDADPALPAEIIDVPLVEVKSPVTRLERCPRKGGSVDLSRARRVVSVGRGLKSRDDLALVEALAAALEAEVGCSRPVAEGENWLERERYVGITGAMLKSDLYLALGISGQVQHMAGVNGVKTLFAVNKDKNAPIFKLVDYGLVGDMYRVMPALTALLRDGR